ncbi:MAG: EAL domain-containing protein [Thermodesulfovibrionales bacterium]
MEDRKEANNSAAYQDTLTGLPNKRIFFDRLSQALARARRGDLIAAVLFLSVDRLKLINDTMGQRCGDQLLKALAERLQGCLRESDTVARPGRDEFMILLPAITHAEDATLVAKKIFSALSCPFALDKREIFVTASIGISIHPNDGSDASALLRNSYTAMQRARETAKNSYKFYSPTMNDKAFERMIMENNLQLALKRNEFFLHYQPQINLDTGQISGMEALVRWQRPGAGVVYPNEFIKLMEEIGLIVPLGEWVLRTACAQSRALQETSRKPMRVAVNLSVRQFQQNIIETVQRVLEDTGLEPNFLELELTESIFVQDVEAAVEVLHAMRRMGVNISIDDFGMGYSSLSYLKYFPINKLKIVEPFISSIAIDPNDAVIAKAIVALAHSLNMKVIAEGVEKEEDLEFIRSLHCDELQGNIFSHPVPAEEIAKLLTSEKHF